MKTYRLVAYRHGEGCNPKMAKLFSLETYNLYSIASQFKRLFDTATIGISPPGWGGGVTHVRSYMSGAGDTTGSQAMVCVTGSPGVP